MSDVWHIFCLFFLGGLILALLGAKGCGFDGKGLRVNIDGKVHYVIMTTKD